MFRSSDEESPDNEKLLDLYWNRNELKKEFADLRTEQFRLKDRIQQQEGASARLQQKLDYLENLLSDPEWFRSIGVYYQLRGLASRCERKLDRFSEQLKQHREQKQHNKILDEWNKRQSQESGALGLEILERRDRIQQLEDQLQAERRLHESLTGLFSFARRRSAGVNIENLNEQLQVESLEEATLKSQIGGIKGRTPPDAPGLDIRAKRSINYMIIAYAQQLFIQFGDSAMVGLVKEASEKSVGSINYGSEAECAELQKNIHACIDFIEGDTDFADILQKRAKLISEIAQFHNDGDAVPVPATVSTLFTIDDRGKVSEADANLLGDNYWRIATILSR